jgi:hypothetical protein
MLVVTVAAAMSLASAARAGENFESWDILPESFESTGGGGVMILDYRPALKDGKCVTEFRARLPDGATFRNVVEFEAVPEQGGSLCVNGRWRSLESDAQGTTPLVVFIKDGVVRRAPAGWRR